MTKRYTSAHALVDTLIKAGITEGTCVPGESYLPVLDALKQREGAFKLYTCRQEGGAATMAEAMGRLNGKPGVCFVTRGPGATNASIGVHNAKQNGTPMLLFIGQVARGHMGREAFQEVDFETMFAPLAKWAVELRDGARTGEIIAQAIRVATSGRPGPVVISLPEDVLVEDCADDLSAPYLAPKPVPEQAQVDAIVERLKAAQKPLILVGGISFDAPSAARLTRLAEEAHIPIVTAFRRQSLIDHRSPAYAGVLGLGPDPKLVAKVEAADCILALGTRLGDIVTQSYELFEEGVELGKLIHVTEETQDIGRVFVPSLGLACPSSAFVNGLGDLKGVNRQKWFETARQDYLDFRASKPEGLKLNPANVFETLRRITPDDIIITNGAGNFSIWAHRYFPLHSFNSQLGPVSGAMGYALPAALGAAALGRTAVAVTGDGDFMMTVQELATAAHHGLKVIVLVLNNGMFGTIRMHQEKHYPGRVSATDLSNPDFAALARAHGLNGISLDSDEEIESMLQEALNAETSTVIELKCDPQQLTPALRIKKQP
ncbi:MAG: thiamine pyrophosphate-binding protein [Sphingomonadales bacterium]|jgi:acetolactate synthase-1/2/3 large subunit